MAQCPDGYDIVMMPRGQEWEALRRAINEGIDDHLEAVRFTQSPEPHRIPAFNKAKLVITPETLHVLVRRLMEFYDENDNEDGGMVDESQQMASVICDTLDIELI